MSTRFQELDWRRTPLGELALRRRWYPGIGKNVYEIKLNDEFLMSSLFTVAEEELGRLALAELTRPALDVLVGGLGLGCTAEAVLADESLRSLVVIDALSEVIEWHQKGLIPAEVASDPRCTLTQGDFFALLRSPGGLDPSAPGRRFDAIIVDIDHSPSHHLHPSHADLYETQGLRRLSEQLLPGGVFALWSNEAPDEQFTATLRQVFTEVRAEVVTFDNPLQGREAANTVYLAKRALSE